MTFSADPESRYVAVRRLFRFIEESGEEGTQWVVFEPNDDATRAAVRRNVAAFLLGVWRSGALAGMTQDEAFFVRSEEHTSELKQIMRISYAAFCLKNKIKPHTATYTTP